MNSRITELYKIIEDAKHEIEVIRGKCPHPKYTVQWYSWRPGAMEPARICDECNERLPGLTEHEDSTLRKKKADELEEWKKKNG